MMERRGAWDLCGKLRLHRRHSKSDFATKVRSLTSDHLVRENMSTVEKRQFRQERRV